MARTKTRKVKKQQKQQPQKQKVLTVPELRRAFEHIEHVSAKIQGRGKGEQVTIFKKEWLATFGRDIDTKAVEAYLSVKHGSKMKKTRKQRGGMSQGAPLDYQTRPGIDGVYGQFPAYIDRGLIPYPEPGITQGCGTQDITPKIPTSLGSNQAGGAATASEFASALTFKPFDSTVPSSVYQDLRSAYLGAQLPPSPAVEDHTWTYK